MGQISQFLRKFNGGISHWCPGCMELHSINTETKNSNGAQWQWDGNIILPTISPSVHILCRDPEGEFPTEICHYFLRAGMLQFLQDCTHKLAGVTMHLPPLPQHFRNDRNE